MIKLVASDIDGTLLPEGNKVLNPEIYDIISELKKHDIHFVVASGRQLESQELLFAPVAKDISYISENGAICQLYGKRYVISEFDRDDAMQIIEELDKRPECKAAISTPSTQYIKSGDEDFYKHMTTHLKYHITQIDSLIDIDEPIVKIAFLDTVNNEASYRHFTELFGDKFKIVNAGNMWIDFVPFDSNKGTSLKFMLEQLNLTPEEAICFGDQQNDIEMLEYAGTSYAMAHAKPDVQKHATNITESVEKTLRQLITSLS
ncbi:MAG: HAD family hydrolase [Tyzzerella sp.]|nr:HAD family hydrolase [Tyzzerella sp.]